MSKTINIIGSISSIVGLVLMIIFRFFDEVVFLNNDVYRMFYWYFLGYLSILFYSKLEGMMKVVLTILIFGLSPFIIKFLYFTLIYPLLSINQIESLNFTFDNEFMGIFTIIIFGLLIVTSIIVSESNDTVEK